ncbi:hypothetical protein ACFVXW_32295 [Streptomyces sp. NPDC058251]|uniref:hypothetical protein n=1 Tax=unclassified Streptomyces TaxID=2593676 RepID=UPI00365C4526
MLRRVFARYSRGFGAAVIAVAALVTAANAGPARAEQPHPSSQAQYADDSAPASTP